MYRRPVEPLSPAAARAAAKLFTLASALIGERTDTAFGTWSIADADLAFALQRLVANGDDVPAPLHAYAQAQWNRPSIREYVQHPRAPFVPYSY
jgi:glutathione S-transferase